MFQFEVKTYPQFHEKTDRKPLKYRSFIILMSYRFFMQRERYESAKKQLSKGRDMFEKVIQRFVELPDWSHLGLICFTEIKSRDLIRQHLPELTKEEIKVYNA